MELLGISVEDLTRAWTAVALLALFLGAYLAVNKVWIRKHERAVAESVSVGAQLLALTIGVPLLVLCLHRGALAGAAALGTLLVVATVLLLIGTGAWVERRRADGFWRSTGDALKREATEATTLLHDLFRPRGAGKVIRVLHGLALIDDQLDDRELAFLRTFASRWNIDFDAAVDGPGQADDDPVSSIAGLRAAMGDYLATTPPVDQAHQLRDVLTALAMIDDRICEREELALDELGRMLDDYGGSGELPAYSVYIAPQSPAQETAVRETMPALTRERRLGGNVFKVGEYYSGAYARLVCVWYRDAGFLTLIEGAGSAVEAAGTDEAGG